MSELNRRAVQSRSGFDKFSAIRRWSAILLAIGCFIAGPAAASVLDWDQVTWQPEGTGNLSETYAGIDGGDVSISFSGNTSALADPTSPALNAFNTGGLNPPENTLYIATDHIDSTDPQVTVFIDFSHPNGVGDIRLTFFDVDGAGTFIDRVQVNACTDAADTVCEELRPTLLATGQVNQIDPPLPPAQVPRAITGTLNAGSPFNSDAGNAEFVFEQIGIRRIKVVYSNRSTAANPGFQSISLHDILFTPTTIADLELDIAVDESQPSVGDIVEFTITVDNQGPSDSTGVTVDELLPDGFSFIGDDSGGAYDPVTGIWDIGDVPAGGSEVLTLVAQVNPSGPYTNVAQVASSNQLDPDSTPGNDIPGEDDQDEVEVRPVDATGPVAVDDQDATDVDTPVAVDVLGNDLGEGPLTIIDASDPANGTAVIDDNGTVDPSDDFIIYTPDPGFTGVDTFEYTIIGPNGQTSLATATILVGPEFLLLNKTASPAQALPGQVVSYAVTIENISGVFIEMVTLEDLVPAGFTYIDGSARLDGDEAAVTVSGVRPVIFSGFEIAPGQVRTLNYAARVGAGVTTGEYRNTIKPIPLIGNEAGATVTVMTDPDFEQTTIIGKVFDDRDGDGWQDEGEQGIPGVRLATVEGVLVETDQHGRYHLAGVEGGQLERGRNFIIKVDDRTLPPGTTFTTENPRVLRITQGLLNRFDFGVRLPGAAGCCQEIEVKLAEVFFLQGSAEVHPEYYPVLTQLAEKLRNHGGGQLTISGSAACPAEGGPTRPSEAREYTLTPRFPVLDATLQPQDLVRLESIAREWSGVQNVRATVVGHTSSEGISVAGRAKFADNYVLSNARARSVADFLQLRLGLSDSQITVAGRGPDDPVATNATADGRSANRRVELHIAGSIPGVGVADCPNPVTRELAERRARRVYQVLHRMLGDDLMRNVDLRISDSYGALQPVAAPVETLLETAIEPSLDSMVESVVEPVAAPQADARESVLSRIGMAVLDLLVGRANAQTTEAICTLESCRSEDGYAVQIITRDKPRARASGDTDYAEKDERRADIHGRFVVQTSNGGSLWATEDPATLDPRLAISGPEMLPVSAAGLISAPASFYVYTNYAAFIDRAELLLYDGRDEDRIAPLATVPVNLSNWTRVDWDPANSAGGAYGTGGLQEGSRLAYRLRVYDAAGNFDETQEFEILLCNESIYQAPEIHALIPRAPLLETSMKAPVPVEQRKTTPLDGNVLVFQPPNKSSRYQSEDYTLTPRFDTRKTILHAPDREELDRIVSEWQGSGDIRITAVGHTDNIRIAPEHRKEFKDNYELARARAWSVANYVRKGLNVRDSHIQATGRGPDDPVASNDTAEGRALNRRVELRITGRRQVENYGPGTTVKLVEPDSGLETEVRYSLDESVNVLKARIDTASMVGDEDPYASPATGPRKSLLAQTSIDPLAAIYGANHLAMSNILVNGSRVRIHGLGVPFSGGVYVNGQPLPIDAGARLAAEFLLPVGEHAFDVEFVDGNGVLLERAQVPVSVTGKYMFLVALADLTLSANDMGGSLEPLAADDRFSEDFLVEGRLAFYLKGKVKGKYLVTAQLDSTEEQLSDLLGNLGDENPRSIFRRLDPDRYYPVYGDDSTTWSDTDSQGRFYVRVDWNHSEALWGNYHTGITDNEFAQYNRSLYGGKYHHRSLDTTSYGEPRLEGQVFVAESQTAFGHSEFRGTGGSVYYLRHRDILPGSEKAMIELRDRDSGRVLSTAALQRGADYEVDEIQGRLILSRPLASIAALSGPDLIRDQPLDGNDLILLVDYEYLPTGLAMDNVTWGGNAKYWLNDTVGVGAALVQEDRDAEDYELGGIDVTLRKGKGSYIKLEYAGTDATQSERFLSADGGLSFAETTAAPSGRSGDAVGVEARINTRELFGTQRAWTGAAWWRDTERDFSVARRDPGVNVTESGAEVVGEINDRLSLSARISVVERGALTEDSRASLQADYQLSRRGQLSGELRQISEERALEQDRDATLGALRYSYQLFETVEVYGIGQFTLDNDSGRYDNNDMATFGTRLRLADHTTLAGEYSSGHRGEGATMTMEHALGGRHTIYGSYTHSTDRTDPLQGNRVALGHRSRVSNQTTLFNEAQWNYGPDYAGLAHVFGLDFTPRRGWNVGLTLQTGTVGPHIGQTLGLPGGTLPGAIDRDAASMALGYQDDRIRWNSRLEYRNDSGATDARQWLSSSRIDFLLNDDLRLLGKVNVSDTDDQGSSIADARFIEASLGFAFRPVAHDRLNVLGKYTYLYDLPSLAQVNASTDQRSQIISGEGIYRISRRWEAGIKLAQRSGELRANRSDGVWYESTTNFAALRGRYHLISSWDGIIEYRTLAVDEAESTRQGWLVGIDRHIGDHMKLGVGFNFTDFSDNLADLDYTHRGWFINALGKY